VKELENKRKSSPLSSSIPRASLVNTLSLDSEADPISSTTSGSDLLAPRKPSFLLSSNRDKAVSLTSPPHFKINNVDHVDPGPPPTHAIVTTAPSAPLVPISSLSPTPADRMGTTMSRARTSTVTPNKKKGILGFITNFLNSNKRPEITTPHDLVHLTHIGFNSSTGELTGLPKEWLQLLQDSGIFNSKSDQEKYPPSVVDKMGHTPIPGGLQSPPVPGTAQSAHIRASKSVDDGVVPAASPFFILPQVPSLTIQSDPRCRLRNRLTLRHHIILRQLHPSLCSTTWAGRPFSERHPNCHAMTRLSAQIPKGIGARPLRYHQ
jgi:hypothetical protein